MVDENKLPEYHEALASAKEHREKADELQASQALEQDESEKQSLGSQATEENQKAEEFENRANEILEQGGDGETPEQASQEQASQEQEGQEQEQDDPSNLGKRAWYKPGSVADDLMLQVGEANEGSIIGNVLEYAARSVFDKEHREFEGAKMLKSLASSPVTAYKGAQSAARSFQSRDQSKDINPADKSPTDRSPADRSPDRNPEQSARESVDSLDARDNSDDLESVDRSNDIPAEYEPQEQGPEQGPQEHDREQEHEHDDIGER